MRFTFKIIVTGVMVAGLIAIAGVAVAQEVESIPSANKSATSATGKTRVKKNTTINFEDELIEGEVKKPELLYLLQKKQFNFKRLIKLRENFLPEMRRTAEDLK